MKLSEAATRCNIFLTKVQNRKLGEKEIHHRSQ
jgi:hypothetical protein